MVSKIADNNIDAFLQGQDQDTDAGSQPGNNDGSNSGDLQGQPGGQSEEEVEFAKLNGSTQDRIRQLIRERNEAAQKAEQAQRLLGTVPPPPPMQPNNPQIQDAVKKLTNIGLADQDFVKQQVSQGVAALQYNYELSRLENTYTGDDGRPKFTREEYEDYVGRHPQYQSYTPEDVYKFKMYAEENRDWETRTKGQNQPVGSSSLRPTRTNRTNEALTPETIEANLQKYGQSWYDKHKDEIEQVLQASAEGQE